MEALHGVATRKVDNLARALGADTGISKSEVSGICADRDEESRRVPDRTLTKVDELGQRFRHQPQEGIRMVVPDLANEPREYTDA